MMTKVLNVHGGELGSFAHGTGLDRIKTWLVSSTPSAALQTLQDTARYMRSSDIPVAFPTETVYGLGAAATRSGAAAGIYKAKGRPSDNPLIVHVSDLDMLRDVLTPSRAKHDCAGDPIPEIYHPLIAKFWPGPLTILLSNPESSSLAPEVTANLPTVGIRMPSNPLALTLIKLVGSPLAAPSANASTRPSTTTAQHCLTDLDGRIEIILDGGPCGVGVESTIVDGLCHPPVILRPGGLSIDDIRNVEGWESTVKGYKDESDLSNGSSEGPRVPGMKYKHYSPTAQVILFEVGAPMNASRFWDLEPIRDTQKIGIIRTTTWPSCLGLKHEEIAQNLDNDYDEVDATNRDGCATSSVVERVVIESMSKSERQVALVDIALGQDTKAIAQGLFSALREMDRRKVELVLVEGIDVETDIGAAVMNRLRKAATIIKTQ